MIPLDGVVHFDVVCHLPSTGAVSDADSTPTFSVFEEATDTPILSAQSMTKRTSLTGDYRGTFTASAANGFEVGKWYSVVASATVGGIAGKVVPLGFQLAAAYPLPGIPEVALGATERTAVADALLTRDWTSVTGEAARSVLNALRFIRNKWTITGATLSVKKENDTTEAWNAAVTTDAAAVPITGNDPA